MRKNPELYFEITLLALILILAWVLLPQATPFINGILGSITLYMLLRRVNVGLTRKLGPAKAALIITAVVTIFLILPLSLLLWYAIDLASSLKGVDLNIDAVTQRINSIVQMCKERFQIELISESSLGFVTKQITSVANMLMAGINNFAINLFTALLLLFFLLKGGIGMERYIARLLPFSDGNKRVIIEKINLIVKSNAIGIPLLAFLQGVVAALGYYLCDIKNPLMFGIITGLCSIIPFVGTMLVWIPLALSQFLEGNTASALMLLSYGAIIISQCDNVLRFILQKKMADIHPLITIFGVIAGIPIFGFMGVIFGPLLISLFLMFIDIFARQYILGEPALTQGKNAAKNQKTSLARPKEDKSRSSKEGLVAGSAGPRDSKIAQSPDISQIKK